MKLSIREDTEMQAITKALVWARGENSWSKYCKALDHSLIANMNITDTVAPYISGPIRRETKPIEITYSQDCFKVR